MCSSDLKVAQVSEAKSDDTEASQKETSSKKSSCIISSSSSLKKSGSASIMFCKVIDRGKNRKLYLYSLSKKKYKKIKGLYSVDQKGQHMRWNSLRDEWVFYSPLRQSRTFLPSENNCPLCASVKGKTLTDIPVTDYEIAVFDNRFSSLSIVSQNITKIEGILNEQSYEIGRAHV